MSRIAFLLAGLVVGAAAAGVGTWLAMGARIESADEGRLEQERRAIDAERDLGKWERRLRVEYERGQGDRDKVDELSARNSALAGQLQELRNRAREEGTAAGADEPLDDPATWDTTRRAVELEQLAAARNRIRRSARLPRVVTAFRAAPDEGYELLTAIFANGLSRTHQLAAVVVLEGLGDPRAAEILRAAWPSIDAADPRDDEIGPEQPDRAAVISAAVRALARLPGEEQSAILLEVYQREAPEPGQQAAHPKLRMTCLAGLAERGHPIAIEVIRDPETPPTLRYRALESLFRRVERRKFIDEELLPVFGEALVAADGANQATAALNALTGFWSDAAVPYLEQFASNTASKAELATRARGMANAIRAGSPRPAQVAVPVPGEVPDLDRLRDPDSGTDDEE